MKGNKRKLRERKGTKGNYLSFFFPSVGVAPKNRVYNCRMNARALDIRNFAGGRPRFRKHVNKKLKCCFSTSGYASGEKKRQEPAHPSARRRVPKKAGVEYHHEISSKAANNIEPNL
jgi:hypothetical protein